MNGYIELKTRLKDYAVRALHAEDGDALQILCEKCADYTMIVEGEEVSPHAAADLFTASPPGRSLEDKILLGLFDRAGEMAGVLEGFRHYPEAGDWWIGLLLLAPEARGKGLGKEVVEAFSEYVRSQGGKAILLGVVEENLQAYRFWEGVGFELARKTEPRQFGKKTQAVLVMRREIYE